MFFCAAAKYPYPEKRQIQMRRVFITRRICVIGVQHLTVEVGYTQVMYCHMHKVTFINREHKGK